MSSPGCGKNTAEIFSVNWVSRGENLEKQGLITFWQCVPTLPKLWWLTAKVLMIMVYSLNSEVVSYMYQSSTFCTKQCISRMKEWKILDIKNNKLKINYLTIAMSLWFLLGRPWNLWFQTSSIITSTHPSDFWQFLTLWAPRRIVSPTLRNNQTDF